ncbi:MAG: TetR/AcrR family transcriptional regulator [Deferribacterales bacterium]
MALPKSQDKRKAILDAAATAIAEIGTDAPTKRIAKLAGIAEGTLFTYFPSKDILLNSLYLDIKNEMADSIMSGYPFDGDDSGKIEHFWYGYVLWGSENVVKCTAMKKLVLCERVTAESRAEGLVRFSEINTLLGKISGEKSSCGVEQPFVSAMLASLADTTIGFMTGNPEKKGKYATIGYKAFTSFLQSI